MSCCHNHSSRCCCFCSSNSTAASSSTSDQLLLQALTSQLLLIQSQSQPQSPIFLKPQPPTIINQRRHQSKDDDPSLLLLLNSLIRRVSALESSLSNLSSPPPHHQKQPPPLRQSLKHVAAATIQRHFRRFLTRRSRTLRDLKTLASIKSHVAALRSSLADKTIKNPRALSRRATDLLSQLDSIQSSDSMIREGRRSISKELVRISEFVDKVLIREREEETDEWERRRNRGRRVSFVENGDEAKVFDDLLERISETHLTDEEGFYDRFSDGEESPRVIRHRGVNGGLGLAAPLPVKMEPRRSGSMKKVAMEED